MGKKFEGTDTFDWYTNPAALNECHETKSTAYSLVTPSTNISSAVHPPARFFFFFYSVPHTTNEVGKWGKKKLNKQIFDGKKMNINHHHQVAGFEEIKVRMNPRPRLFKPSPCRTAEERENSMEKKNYNKEVKHRIHLRMKRERN
jgi:hypothetical protein